MSNIIELQIDKMNEEARAFVAETSNVGKEIHAFEIGVSVLNRVQQGKDLDFVKKEIDGMLNKVNLGLKTFADIIVETWEKNTNEKFDPTIPTSFSKRFGDFMNMSAVAFKDSVSADLARVKDELKRIEENTSEKDGSMLSRTKKLIIETQDYLQKQFDMTNTESYASKLLLQFNSAISALDKTVGGTIEAKLRTEIQEQLKPIIESLNQIRETVAKEEGKSEIMELTSAKGFVFEEVLFERLQSVAQPFGDAVEQAGLKKDVSGSQKGDFIYTTSDKKQIIIEAKDKPVMLKESQDYMKLALASRGAKFGILVCKTHDQLQKQIGRWSVYENDNLIICCIDDIEISLKYAKSRLILTDVASSGVNVGTINTKLAKVAEEMKKVSYVRTQFTNIKKAVEDGTSKAAETLDEMQKNISSLMNEIQTELSKQN